MDLFRKLDPTQLQIPVHVEDTCRTFDAEQPPTNSSRVSRYSVRNEVYWDGDLSGEGRYPFNPRRGGGSDDGSDVSGGEDDVSLNVYGGYGGGHDPSRDKNVIIAPSRGNGSPKAYHLIPNPHSRRNQRARNPAASKETEEDEKGLKEAPRNSVELSLPDSMTVDRDGSSTKAPVDRTSPRGPPHEVI